MSVQENSALIPSGKGRSLWWGDILVTFKVLGGDTDGAFAVMEDVVPPHYSTPLHIHSREDERVYVVSGEFTFQVGDEVFQVKAGDYINMPRERIHNFKNHGDTQGVLLVTFSPEGIEEMFYEMGHPVEDPALPPPRQAPEDLKRIVAIAQRYGVEIKLPSW
jgi:quercetin dioxygenase-like cupin family protein